MKAETRRTFKSTAFEIAVYGVLVSLYFFLVLHFLGNWLYRLFTEERRTYAFVALALVVAQGFLLEQLTGLLLRWSKIKPRD